MKVRMLREDLGAPGPRTEATPEKPPPASRSGTPPSERNKCAVSQLREAGVLV